MLRFASVASRRPALGLANLARSSRPLQPLRAYMQTRSPTVNLTRRRIELPLRAPVARANVAAMAPLARPSRTDAMSMKTMKTVFGLSNLARSSRHLRAYMPTRSPAANLTPRRRIELPLRPPVARANVAAMAPFARPSRIDAINARPSMSKKTRMIVVYGFGCNKYPKEVEERHAQLLKNMNRSIVSDIDVMCNTTEPQSMTYDIWRRLFASKRILEPTKFVMRVMDAVCQALRRGEEVILVGHSYGGSVASRIAMFIGTALGGSCSASQTFNRSDHLVTSIAQTGSMNNAAINHARRTNLMRVV